MKRMTLYECLPRLANHAKVVKLASSFGFNASDELLLAAEGSDSDDTSKLDEFHDGLIDLLEEEGAEVGAVEVEMLSSYATTSYFYLNEFGGVFWIKNLEMGDLGYFLSEEEAKLALKNEYGIEWEPLGSSS